MSPRVLVVRNVVRNADVDPSGRLSEWLPEAGLRIEPVDGAELPAELRDYDGLVVLGGPMAAGDDRRAEWLPRERELLRQAVSDELPTLAICLGAQLLALAHGGRVRPCAEGPELGAQLVAKRAAAATDPLFRAMPITPDVVQWHHDEISSLPAGAIQLASSPVCANQAFRIGRLAWGLQFHIEADPDMVRSWGELDAALIDDYDLDSIVSRVAELQDDLAEVWRPFVHSFADVVRDPASVPAPRTLASATAEPVTDPAAIRAALAAEAQQSRTSLPPPRMRRDE